MVLSDLRSGDVLLWTRSVLVYLHSYSLLSFAHLLVLLGHTSYCSGHIWQNYFATVTEPPNYITLVHPQRDVMKKLSRMCRTKRINSFLLLTKPLTLHPVQTAQ